MSNFVHYRCSLLPHLSESTEGKSGKRRYLKIHYDVWRREVCDESFRITVDLLELIVSCIAGCRLSYRAIGSLSWCYYDWDCRVLWFDGDDWSFVFIVDRKSQDCRPSQVLKIWIGGSWASHSSKVIFFVLCFKTRLFSFTALTCPIFSSDEKWGERKWWSSSVLGSLEGVALIAVKGLLRRIGRRDRVSPLEGMFRTNGCVFSLPKSRDVSFSP